MTETLPDLPPKNGPPNIFDRALISRRLTLAGAQATNFVTGLAAEDLAQRLITVTRTFETAALLGPDAAALPGLLLSGEGEVRPERFSTLVPGPALVDPEALHLPRRDYQLIVSLLDLQSVNDVPGYLARLRAHLRPDGLMLAAALGGDTLGELRAAFLAAESEMTGGAQARVAPFIDVRSAGSLLQRAGFALPVTDLETHCVRYADPMALIQELRAFGASNPLAARAGKMMRRDVLARACDLYTQAHSDPDGRICATLEILWMSGWAPDPSQQKPLRPGSAEVSLKSVLSKGVDD